MQSCGIYLLLLFTLDIKCVSFFNSFVKVSRKYSQGGGTFVWQWLKVSTKNVSRDDEPTLFTGMVEFKSHIHPWQLLTGWAVQCKVIWYCFLTSFVVIICECTLLPLVVPSFLNSMCNRCDKGETFVGWCLPRLKMYIINVSAKIRDEVLLSINILLH